MRRFIRDIHEGTDKLLVDWDQNVVKQKETVAKRGNEILGMGDRAVERMGLVRMKDVTAVSEPVVLAEALEHRAKLARELLGEVVGADLLKKVLAEEKARREEVARMEQQQKEARARAEREARERAEKSRHASIEALVADERAGPDGGASDEEGSDGWLENPEESFGRGAEESSWGLGAGGEEEDGGEGEGEGAGGGNSGNGKGVAVSGVVQGGGEHEGRVAEEGAVT